MMIAYTTRLELTCSCGATTASWIQSRTRGRVSREDVQHAVGHHGWTITRGGCYCPECASRIRERSSRAAREQMSLF